MNTKLIEKITARYKSKFGSEPQVLVYAPGRINLLGEHTDYNEGFVLPGAIDKAIYIAMGKCETTSSTVFSIDFNEEDTFLAQDNITRGNKGWSNYIRGVVKQMFNRNVKMGQFQAVFSGDIPVGSGLSSSAALECGFGHAFNQLFVGNLSKMDLAFAGQAAEHEFTGVKCGIMDQFASVFGGENQVIQLDCRSMEYKHHPLDLGNHELILFNSMVHHELASSEYNTRREQCEEGVEALSKYVNPEIKSLRDATLNDLKKIKEKVHTKTYDRCRYIIEENKRVETIIDALHQNDLTKVGKIMRETHEGLSKLYEVSCDELDYLIALIDKEEAVLGGRMMGGGFGGCTINLIPKEISESITAKITDAYYKKYHKNIEVYRVSLSEGVRVI
ncbi:MAG: galactokinase, partial [Cyclobacteriaceae bacterium]|nr:galactokinase [Cyclobacteriaceae bacterium]